MPPIKGRMMSRMGGPVPSVQRDTKEVRNVKKVTVPQKKWKTSPVKSEGNVPLNISDDEKLMQLRMPSDIVQSLPSVKKYKGGRDFVDLTDSLSVSGESSKSDVIMEDDRCSVTSGPSSSQSVNQLGSKKARGAHNKYVLKLLAEERFCSMIWDVCISPTGDIFVSCCEGIFICDEDLERKSKLDKVILPGGVDFLLDGQIVALCRQMDTVNFFTKDGVFIRSFPAGFSPMGLIVNAKDKIIISDPGEKCVHIFDATGTEVKRVATSGKGYKLQWPLYLSRVDEQSFVMSDCHAQSVHKFMNNGRFISTYKLKTYGGNEVLRPHGLCTYQEQDLFVIDTSLDSVEVFTWDDCFVQTLIPHEEGITLKPKCMRLNEETGVMVVGGRKGVVRVYQFVDIKEQQNNQINLMSTQHNQRQRSKQHKDIMQVVKQEVKSESFDNDDVIILE